MKKGPLFDRVGWRGDRLVLVRTIIAEDYKQTKGHKRGGSVSDLARLISLEKELSECSDEKTPLEVRWVTVPETEFAG